MQTCKFQLEQRTRLLFFFAAAMGIVLHDPVCSAEQVLACWCFATSGMGCRESAHADPVTRCRLPALLGEVHVGGPCSCSGLAGLHDILSSGLRAPGSATSLFSLRYSHSLPVCPCLHRYLLPLLQLLLVRLLWRRSSVCSCSCSCSNQYHCDFIDLSATLQRKNRTLLKSEARSAKREGPRK